MEAIFCWSAIIMFWIIRILGYLRNKFPPSSNSAPSPNSPKKKTRVPKQNVYNPALDHKDSQRSTIRFGESQAVVREPTDLDLTDLVDALTGAPLQRANGLHQCRQCKVFYQTTSFEVIRTENGGKCVACPNTDLVAITGTNTHRGRNAQVNLITLENYTEHVGHVITFEGKVLQVAPSRSGRDYAVMFERQGWKRSFKLVIFNRHVPLVGTPRSIKNLENRTVRVRGLLACHPRYGYQIIVNDRAMFLSIT